MDFEGRKVLGGTFYFLLPEDFDGDFSDALHLMAEYWKNHPNKSKQRVNRKIVSMPELWKEFWEHIQTGLRVHGHFTFSAMNEQKWESLNDDKPSGETTD